MRHHPVLLLTSLLIAAPVLATGEQPSPAAAGSPLTVERVASLPSLIGTAPASPSWSPDSQWLAFRWNDAGWPFRDIYLVRADGTGLRRLTDMQRTDSAPGPPAGTSTEALSAQAAARARPGVSELAWLPDSHTLLFVARGRLFRVALDGGEPQRQDTGEGVSDIAVSPDGARLAFLRDGDIWSWPLAGTEPAARLTRIAAKCSPDWPHHHIKLCGAIEERINSNHPMTTFGDYLAELKALAEALDIPFECYDEKGPAPFLMPGASN
jgi:dipeptidyl-peptidase-4